MKALQTDYDKLAELLLPDIHKTPEDWERQFPERKLPKGAQVTRLAPSPTGFIHLGNLFGALTDERVAHQSGGVFYLRIEDTDAKREVEGAVETVIDVLKYFGIEFDEGAGAGQAVGAAAKDGAVPGTDAGPTNTYGPYFQRQRAEIYQTYAKDLIRKGRAYPCFCTEEELQALKEKQTAANVLTGYHTGYAKCRNLTYEEIEARVQANMPFVIRLRSEGKEDGRITFTDTIKGEIAFPENMQDIVILKSDGIPTYHFAHVVDDHLMRTTLVVRGDDWLSSVPIHLELFKVLGFAPIQYAHTANLMKMDGESKRKLSKRKDPELSLDFYRKDGYHPHCVKVYLMTLLNSNFEEWYDKHPNAPITDFKFDVHRMTQAGALFDMEKLHSICRNEFAKMDTDAIYEFLYTWAEEYAPDLFRIHFQDENYLKRIIDLFAGAGQKRRRKDFQYASQMMKLFSFFFDETFTPCYEFRYDMDIVCDIVDNYLATYDHTVDNNSWFDKVKAVAEACGFASDMKAYKAAPQSFRGSVADVAEILRIIITGSANSPDLWSILQILGEERMRARMKQVLMQDNL